MDDTPTPLPSAPPPSGLPGPGMLPGPGSDDEKQMAMWAHLSGLATYVVPMWNVLGPLIIWLTKRETMPYLDQEGKEALNFNISITLYAVISFVLMCAFVGFVLIFAVMIFHLIYVILASMEASKGRPYRYPLTIRFVN